MIYEEIQSVYELHKNDPIECMREMIYKGVQILQAECKDVAEGKVKMTKSEFHALYYKINNSVNIFSAKLNLAKNGFQSVVKEIWPEIFDFT